jgi:SAM-dependent methyltransferase
VDRLAYIAERCRGKTVLDVGCFDETALQKRNTEHWLHGRIAAVARRVVGVDSSSAIPAEGIVTAPNAVIHRGDGVDLDPAILASERFDVIVAGEFIEHIESPSRFFRNLRQAFAGREFVLSTPNGVAFANTLMGTIGREAQHHDHVHNFTFKTLNTLCLRAGFDDWEIIPYRFFATEMLLASHGVKRACVLGVERSIRIVERMFPLLSFGYVVRIRL